MTPWQPLLEWWFGPPTSAAQVSAARHALWFGYKPSQDREAQALFGTDADAALAGGLQAWARCARGWLALILLLDQRPRMMYRGTPRAFAGDVQARVLLTQGLAQGWQLELAPIEQAFIYLVLEHHESMTSQEQAVAYFQALRNAAEPGDRKVFAGFLDVAQRHRDVVRRFGRFPHRNAVLGRDSTPDEQAYLAEPGAGF